MSPSARNGLVPCTPCSWSRRRTKAHSVRGDIPLPGCSGIQVHPVVAGIARTVPRRSRRGDISCAGRPLDPLPADASSVSRGVVIELQVQNEFGDDLCRPEIDRTRRCTTTHTYARLKEHLVLSHLKDRRLCSRRSERSRFPTKGTALLGALLLRWLTRQASRTGTDVITSASWRAWWC